MTLNNTNMLRLRRTDSKKEGLGEMLCQAPWVGGEARAPGNRQLDTGFEEGRRPSERRACRGEGLGSARASPMGRLAGWVGAERAWRLARAHLRVRGFGQGVFLRYSWVLHLGRQCTAKRRASRKAEVDQGPADIRLWKRPS